MLFRFHQSHSSPPPKQNCSTILHNICRKKPTFMQNIYLWKFDGGSILDSGLKYFPGAVSLHDYACESTGMWYLYWPLVHQTRFDRITNRVEKVFTHYTVPRKALLEGLHQHMDDANTCGNNNRCPRKSLQRTRYSVDRTPEWAGCLPVASLHVQPRIDGVFPLKIRLSVDAIYLILLALS